MCVLLSPMFAVQSMIHIDWSNIIGKVAIYAYVSHCEFWSHLSLITLVIKRFLKFITKCTFQYLGESRPK